MVFSNLISIKEDQIWLKLVKILSILKLFNIYIIGKKISATSFKNHIKIIYWS